MLDAVPVGGTIISGGARIGEVERWNCGVLDGPDCTDLLKSGAVRTGDFGRTGDFERWYDCKECGTCRLDTSFNSCSHDVRSNVGGHCMGARFASKA